MKTRNAKKPLSVEQRAVCDRFHVLNQLQREGLSTQPALRELHSQIRVLVSKPVATLHECYVLERTVMDMMRAADENIRREKESWQSLEEMRRTLQARRDLL